MLDICLLGTAGMMPQPHPLAYGNDGSVLMAAVYRSTVAREPRLR